MRKRVIKKMDHLNVGDVGMLNNSANIKYIKVEETDKWVKTTYPSGMVEVLYKLTEEEEKALTVNIVKIK